LGFIQRAEQFDQGAICRSRKHPILTWHNRGKK
jgi:hypothetical protein